MTDATEPTPCCKCAAYEQIISGLHAKIAAARRDLATTKDFSEHALRQLEKGLKELP